VFTDRPFRGNQLAVFPDAGGLDADVMQEIAAEMAFPESSFVFAPNSDATYVHVRIFTPRRELPMAGHPTIGTAFALAHEGRIARGRDRVTLGLGVGPTPVSLEWSGRELEFAWMAQPVPEFGAAPARIAALAQALGVGERDIGATGLPVREVSSGVPFLFVPLISRQAVDRVAVDRSALRRFFDAEGLAELPVFVFTLESGADDATVFSRMFAPAFGVAEDPATGGAGGPLGAYLVVHEAIPADRAAHIVSLQGAAMGRPSRIHISVASRDGHVSAVRAGGRAVLVGSGSLVF
jgi:trans-2,3-dihydro-3-hydroxyanthranilate isomerase